MSVRLNELVMQCETSIASGTPMPTLPANLLRIVDVSTSADVVNLLTVLAQYTKQCDDNTQMPDPQPDFFTETFLSMIPDRETMVKLLAVLVQYRAENQEDPVFVLPRNPFPVEYADSITDPVEFKNLLTVAATYRVVFDDLMTPERLMRDATSPEPFAFSIANFAKYRPDVCAPTHWCVHLVQYIVFALSFYCITKCGFDRYTYHCYMDTIDFAWIERLLLSPYTIPQDPAAKVKAKMFKDSPALQLIYINTFILKYFEHVGRLTEHARVAKKNPPVVEKATGAALTAMNEKSIGEAITALCDAKTALTTLTGGRSVTDTTSSMPLIAAMKLAATSVAALSTAEQAFGSLTGALSALAAAKAAVAAATDPEDVAAARAALDAATTALETAKATATTAAENAVATATSAIAAVLALTNGTPAPTDTDPAKNIETSTKRTREAFVSKCTRFNAYSYYACKTVSDGGFPPRELACLYLPILLLTEDLKTMPDPESDEMMLYYKEQLRIDHLHNGEFRKFLQEQKIEVK